MRMDYGVLGLRIILQSDKDPQILDERAEAFLATFPVGPIHLLLLVLTHTTTFLSDDLGRSVL